MMRKNLLPIIVFVLSVLFIAPNAFAANVEVVGKVNNPNTSTLGSSVIFKDTTSQNAVTTTVNPDGTYATSLPQGTYDVSIVPPAGSGLLPMTKKDQQITANTVANFSVATVPHYMKNSQPSTPMNMPLAVGAVVIVLGIGIGYLLWKKMKA